MDIIQAIVLGGVQGLTEFLPISSSGHLILVPAFLGWPDQGLAFDAMVHFGTACAALYHYRADCHHVLRSVFQRNPDPSHRQLRNAILLGSIPALIAALLFKDAIDGQARNAAFVAFNLVFWGVVLIIADRVAKRHDSAALEMQPPTAPHAIIAGVAQAIALLPGTSRSGITISAALFSGLNRPSAVRFSFLLGLPIILGVSLLSGLELIGQVRDGTMNATPLVAGLLASFVGGLAAIRLLLAVVSRGGLTVFAIYRFVLAAIVVWTIR